jgi:hypothetical protein
MAHTRRTLTLTHPGWDITLDDTGRLAVTSGAMATAQAVANDVRLFTDDAYFARDRGIPHFAVELGQKRSPSLIRSFIYRACASIPDVREVTDVNVSGFDPETRRLSGEIAFTTQEDADHAARRIDL